jgi:hypothetical protein
MLFLFGSIFFGYFLGISFGDWVNRYAGYDVKCQGEVVVQNLFLTTIGGSVKETWEVHIEHGETDTTLSGYGSCGLIVIYPRILISRSVSTRSPHPLCASMSNV